MKKIPTTKKARSMTSGHTHLRPDGKRRANKGTRQVTKVDPHESQADFEMDQAILSQTHE